MEAKVFQSRLQFRHLYGYHIDRMHLGRNGVVSYYLNYADRFQCSQEKRYRGARHLTVVHMVARRYDHRGKVMRMATLHEAYKMLR